MKNLLFTALLLTSFLISHAQQRPNRPPGQGGPPELRNFDEMFDSLAIAQTFDDSLTLIGRMTIAPYVRMGHAEKVKELAELAIKMCEGRTPADKNRLPVIMSNLASVYSDEGQHVKATEYSVQAISACDKADCDVQYILYNVLGFIFKRVENHEKAIEYFKLSSAFASERSFSSDINAATSYLSLEQYDSALLKIDQYIDFNQLNPQNLFAYMVFHDANLFAGNIEEADKTLRFLNEHLEKPGSPKFIYDITYLNVRHLQRKELFDSALFYAQKLQTNPFKLQDKTFGADMLFAEIHMRLKQFQKAISILEPIHKQSEQSENSRLKSSIHGLLAECYKNTANYEKAIFHVEKAGEYREILRSNEVKLAVNRKEVDYVFDKVEQEKKILQANLRRANTEQKFTYSILIFIFLSLVLTYTLFVKTTKSNKQLSGKNVQIEKLMKELNHRVKNNLQLISSIINLQSHAVADGQAKTVLKDSKLRMQALSILHQKLYQMEDLTEVNCANYFEELIENLKLAFVNAGKSVQTNLNVSNQTLNIDYVIPLGLIINELVTNSLKHAKAEDLQINLSLQFNDDKWMLIYSDNGDHFDIAAIEKSQSFGIEMIKSLADQIKSKPMFESKTGLHFSLSFQTNG